MIEIELFFKTVESEIRRRHIRYLKNQKCLPSDRTEPNVPTETSTVSAAANEDDFIYSDNPKLKEKAKRVKSFNKGIDTALKALQNEYNRFKNRFDSQAGCRRKV